MKFLKKRSAPRPKELHQKATCRMDEGSSLKQWFSKCGPQGTWGLSKCTFSGPAPDLLTQKLRKWGPGIWVLTSPSGDSEASSSSSTTM